MTLEASRAPFGRGLGSSWALFGRSWALLAPLGRFLGASWTLLGVSLAPLGPLERILDPQGSIWGPLWALKTRFGVDFGRVWGESGEDLDNSWWFFGRSKSIFLFFQHWGPPRCLAKPRGASQCAGVPDPTRVKCFFHQLILDHITSLLGGVKPPGSGHRVSRR